VIPNASCDLIEHLGLELERGLARVRKEADLGKRRELLRTVGPLVGQLLHAMEAGAQRPPAHEQDLLKIAREHCIGGAIGEVLELGSWTLSEDEPAAELEKETSD
jgi:hypothetical protein